MSTKMKGLLKGLRYISQIFDEEKQPEMQIGFPTDVKHVAHIGWDGPSVDSPSWMNEFKGPAGHQSAPLGPSGEPQEGPEIKWVSEDSKSNSRNGSSRESPDVPKSSRPRSSENSSTGDSTKKEVATKKGSRKQSKDQSGEGSVGRRQIQDQGGESSSGNPPDIPKKTRRKKSKELVNGGCTKTSRPSKGTTTTTTTSSSTHLSPFSDPGPDRSPSKKDEISHYSNSSLQLPHIPEDDEKESSGIS